MPLAPFAALLIAVIAAAGVTVWLLSFGGQMALMIALPLFLIATAAVTLLRK